MKIMLTIGFLLLASVGCNQTNVRPDRTSTIGTAHYTQQLNAIGTRFIASFQKNNQKAAYQLLDPALKTKLSLNDFGRHNAKLVEYYGSVTRFKRAAKPMRGVRVLPDGRNVEAISMWYPVKTSQYPNGAIRLKISFNRDSRNPKIIRYTFMKPRGG